MIRRTMHSAVLLCCVAICATTSQCATERTPHELFDALNALRVDPAAVYRLETENRIGLSRGDARLSFDEGKLAFFSALDGHITGAVFAGRGHAVAAPRNPVEKQQMARFLSSTVLDEDFTFAYLRFTKETAEELLSQLQSQKVKAQKDAAFATRWDSFAALSNSGPSLRLLDALLKENPEPYFYAGIEGVATGPFEVLYDLQRTEPFLLGQPRRGNAHDGAAEYYDTWASYAPAGDTGVEAKFRALQYTINTAIAANTSLEATATVEIAAISGGERLLAFALSRALQVDSVTDDQGKFVTFLQNEGLGPYAASVEGDSVFVVLPRAVSSGEHLSLRFHYRGNVIADAGNEVLVVQARDSWYPRLGDSADFADYDLTIRWPRKLQLVATGTKLDERLDGDTRVGHWRSEHLLSVAGFNLGEYTSASVAGPAYSVELFANRQLEQSLRNRLQPPASAFDLPSLARGGISSAELPKALADGASPPPVPRPADALKDMGKEIASSIRFYETFSGPFPFRTLSVSQIPGNFGQGWPGLLYLSTFAYLSPETQRQAGLSASGQEHFTQLVPFHEVAHQWWGNVVGWSSYRDQWIDEAIANYLALLFADSHKGSERQLRVWLDRYRKSLLAKPDNGDEPAAETGALTLGSRLDSSRGPHAYDLLIYNKGSWVIHMLREMLRQPKAQNPDARFTRLLQTLVNKYAYRALSTAELQKEVETVMTPAMDLEGGRSMEWFFDEWVRGTGIPHYHVEFTTEFTEKGVLVKGTLQQSGVPRSFIAPVPIYAAGPLGHDVLLGTITAEGPKTTFRFLTQTPPHKLLIDPEMTLLCVSE